MVMTVELIALLFLEENLWPPGDPIAKPATSGNGSNCLYKLTECSNNVPVTNHLDFTWQSILLLYGSYFEIESTFK